MLVRFLNAESGNLVIGLSSIKSNMAAFSALPTSSKISIVNTGGCYP